MVALTTTAFALDCVLVVATVSVPPDRTLVFMPASPAATLVALPPEKLKRSVTAVIALKAVTAVAAVAPVASVRLSVLVAVSYAPVVVAPVVTRNDILEWRMDYAKESARMPAGGRSETVAVRWP